MRRSNIIAVTVLAALMTGCTMIPNIKRPEFSAAENWNHIEGYQAMTQGQNAAQVKWREFFVDARLQQVIATALNNNKDLRLAALNIEEARAQYRIERADLYPNIDANLDSSFQNSSDESSATGQEESTELHQANIGIASYELDLFGRVRSQNIAALNDYFATRYAKDVVKNALIAETANAYLQLLTDQKLLALTEKTLRAQLRTYELLTQSRDKGITTDQDVARVETAVETARVNYHQYQRFVEQDKNALTLLMGIAHNDALIPQGTLDDIVLPVTLTVGLPSKALLSRPDIHQAEYELLARSADIGAARAAFFPNISLTGTYGFASDQLSQLFSGGAFGAWSFMPQMTVPIFQGGRNEANLDLANVRQEQAIVNYEKTIQVAFREVSDQLAARATLSQQLAAQQRLVAAAQKVYNASYARYTHGIDSFLSALDAQRELYAFQQDEIRLENQRLGNLVNLYKVLGGGV